MRRFYNFRMKSRLKNVYVLYSISARTAFEKMTDVDYQGETYYTIRNLSLYECQVSLFLLL